MAQIQLKSKDRTPIFVEVDDDEVERLSAYTWSWSGGYAKANVKASDGSRTVLAMHRLLMDAPVGFIVDHINGKKLDNRKSNLRLATTTENNRNQRKTSDPFISSMFVGVSRRHADSKLWTATIQKATLGHYESEEEAAYVRDQAAMQLYGEFAFTNFNYEDSA